MSQVCSCVRKKRNIDLNLNPHIKEASKHTGFHRAKLDAHLSQLAFHQLEDEQPLPLQQECLGLCLIQLSPGVVLLEPRYTFAVAVAVERPVYGAALWTMTVVRKKINRVKYLWQIK